MKNSWLVSKFAYSMFLYSVWAIVCLGLYIVFEMTPWFQQVETFHVPGLVVFLLGVALSTVGEPAILIIYFGMAIYCICRDCSSVGKKIALIVFILFTPPFGAIVYFFTVYRKQWAIHREAAHG